MIVCRRSVLDNLFMYTLRCVLKQTYLLKYTFMHANTRANLAATASEDTRVKEKPVQSHSEFLLHRVIT